MQKKYMADLTVISNEDVTADYYLLKVRIDGEVPEVRPGQFVEIKVKGADGVMLRRPISIHDFDPQKNELTMLIRKAGEGTKTLSKVRVGDKIDVVYPLGNGFNLAEAGKRPLLVGGGVGVAPLYMLAKELKAQGAEPTFLFGARTADGLLCREKYEAVAPVLVATEDGSEGVKGFVTDHSCFSSDAVKQYTSVMQCGPTPMMKAVAKKMEGTGVECYASLENMMACGIGVCLCCVTDTLDGNKRVCADGPVFNVKELKW